MNNEENVKYVGGTSIYFGGSQELYQLLHTVLLTIQCPCVNISWV